MTFDDRLRKLTDDIGRGKDERMCRNCAKLGRLCDWCAFARTQHEHDWWPFEDGSRACTICGTVDDGDPEREGQDRYVAEFHDVPLASDAMAERDDHGEVKGVMF